MDSNDILNNMLDYDIYIRRILDEVQIEDGQHPPPLYNIINGFHTILQSQINNMIQESRNNDALTLSEFDTKIHNIMNKETKECSICLEEIKENSICSALPCLHMFHEGCIKRWLTLNKASCPICRNDV